MRVHHLDCITQCPYGGRLMDGESGTARLTCHCVLLETPRGLVLIDTGFGLNDVHHPRPRLSPFFLKMNRPQLVESDTAVRQIERLGFSAGDVRHILLSHLDFDHAGGLDDFPEAQIHLLASEREVAFAQRSWLDRQRFRPQQWDSANRWLTYPSSSGESWFGFDAVRELEGVPPEILFIPLFGHTLGHAGIAYHDGRHWSLYAGDAYFYFGEMDPRGYRCTPGLRSYQRLMEQDHKQRIHNQKRLRHLVKTYGREVRVFSAHDLKEFEALRAESGIAPDAVEQPGYVQ